MIDFSSFEKRIGIAFKHQDLLVQAFTHRSYLNEDPTFRLDQNERLEFLGDAVLELIVTEYLYNTYPNPEGELTNWRAALVNSTMLAKVATDLGMNEYLLLSKGEAKDVGRARQYILANAFEALIGALYLDRGYEKTRDFIRAHLLGELPHIIEAHLYKDPKSRFQEEAQDRVSVTPNYRVTREWGPDHAKHFLIGVFLGEEFVAEGEGPSKQLAEQEAARNALEKKGW